MKPRMTKPTTTAKTKNNPKPGTKTKPTAENNPEPVTQTELARLMEIEAERRKLRGEIKDRLLAGSRVEAGEYTIEVTN